MKSEATRALRAAGHFTDQRPWVDHGWNVYLDSDPDVVRAVDYVNANPQRDGQAPQRWEYVIPYDPAHSRAALRHPLKFSRVARDALSGARRKRVEPQMNTDERRLGNAKTG